MAAPILWTPGKMRSFCRKKKPISIKFLLLGGGGILGFGGGGRGGGSADFVLMGARIFLNLRKALVGISAPKKNI